MSQEIHTNKGIWNTRQQEPLVEKLTDYISAGCALDMGAGPTGRDAFYLASKGFETIAAEIDAECIKELNRRNNILSKPLKVIKADILSWKSKQQFDVIVCNMVLHFLKAHQVPTAIKHLQHWTKPGGYNVVMAYTTKNPPDKRPYLFKPNELASYYQKWDKLVYTEGPTPWFQLEGELEPRRNHAVYILARKPMD